MELEPDSHDQTQIDQTDGASRRRQTSLMDFDQLSKGNQQYKNTPTKPGLLLCVFFLFMDNCFKHPSDCVWNVPWGSVQNRSLEQVPGKSSCQISLNYPIPAATVIF